MNSACRIVCFGRNGCALSWRRAVVVAGGATEGSPAILAGTAAVVDDDALAVLVAVVVTLLVGGDDDAGCSAGTVTRLFPRRYRVKVMLIRAQTSRVNA